MLKEFIAIMSTPQGKWTENIFRQRKYLFKSHMVKILNVIVTLRHNNHHNNHHCGQIQVFL